MIPAWAALSLGLVLSAHFSTVRTVFGLFDRPGYLPPESWIVRVRRVRRFREDPAFPVGVSLGRSLGTLLFVLGGWNLLFPTGAASSWMVLPAGLLFLFLLYLLGDFLPRLHARMRTERLLPVSLAVQEVLHPLLLPACLPVVHLRRVLERRLGWDGRFDFLTEQERTKVRETRQDRDSVEREIIRAALDLGETRVREILTPRLQVVSLPADASPEQVVSVLRESGYSRLPVHDGGLDRIVGIVHAKDLVGRPSGWRLPALLRPVIHVPETQLVSDLLRALRTRQAHLAVVVDEHGAVSGIATLEDVLEEIVGEIRDETDEEPPLVRRMDEWTFLVRGETRLDELAELLGPGNPALPPPPEELEVHTLAGLLLTLSGRIPGSDERLAWGDWELSALEREGNRVSLLRLARVPAQESSRATDSDEGQVPAASP
jgi:CBS domain containing-hemolysin-like protein